MPKGSLAKFEEAARTAKNGFIKWESIDGSWKTYEDALKSVIDRVFRGTGAPEGLLKKFYDALDAINEVNCDQD